MAATYWHKQTTDKPLFPDLLWSRPENRAHAGKLLIVGGNQFGFAAPGEAFAEANKAGIGLTRVLLPLSVKKVTSGLLPDLEFGQSTPSGSFSQQALGELLDHAAWADAVLLTGDFGRNSETAILLESFLSKHDGAVTLTKDSIEFFLAHPDVILDRTETLIVATMAQLQKLAISSHYHSAFTLNMGLVQLVDTLHDFTQTHLANIIVRHLDHQVVAVDGQISTTPVSGDMWRIHTASYASVWWLQNSSQPFQALTTTAADSNQSES